MKKIQIKDKFHRQLELLVEIGGTTPSKIINEVMIAGLIEISRKTLAGHDEQNNPSIPAAADRRRRSRKPGCVLEENKLNKSAAAS